MSLRSPLGRVLGHGAAKEGVHHWWVQRVTAIALIPLTFVVARTLYSGKVGVDIIALIAMAGSLYLGQYLAGAVIALMLSGGQVLEEYAESKARKELSALLGRTPRTVNRLDGDTILTIAIEEVKPGDFLMVKPGGIVPVDGVVSAAPPCSTNPLSLENRNPSSGGTGTRYSAAL